jgi:D-aminoacyl-tRNA deacylase
MHISAHLTTYSTKFYEIFLSIGVVGMHDQFEVTLEATHHGPHVDLPTCFVEIGKPLSVNDMKSLPCNFLRILQCFQSETK